MLAEAPVGGGGGDDVASLSWRGDGQFLASLVSARGAEPQLRVWEREDLTFHATGESLRPARISAGIRAGETREFSLDGDGEKNGEAEAEPDSMPHAPPLAWQPRGALVAVACAPARARGLGRRLHLRLGRARRRGVAPARRKRTRRERRLLLPPTEAEIVFFEARGCVAARFTLPRRGAGVEVTSLAWSCDSNGSRCASPTRKPFRTAAFSIREPYRATERRATEKPNKTRLFSAPRRKFGAAETASGT